MPTALPRGTGYQEEEEHYVSINGRRSNPAHEHKVQVQPNGCSFFRVICGRGALIFWLGLSIILPKIAVCVAC